MTELANRMEQLTPERRELLELLLKRKEAPAAKYRIERRHGAESPLSFAQLRLWFLDRLEPGSAAYNIGRAVRLSGPLCLDTLRRALQEILRRHEVLRARFDEVGSEPVQRVCQVAPLQIPQVDLSGLAPAAREGEGTRLAGGERRRGFDLRQGPLLRAVFLRLDAEEHLALLTLHHIVGDGWSMGLLVREISRLYEAFLTGSSSPLADLPIQYADFSRWQRRRLQGAYLESQLAFWRERLRELPQALDLPTDFPRPPVQSSRGATHSFTFSDQLSQELAELGRSEGATLFAVLLAAFKVLLYRYSGQPRFAIGTPVAGREATQTESLIGCFVNTLVFAATLEDTTSFRNLVRKVQRTAIEAQEHQSLPFEQLVEHLAPERSLGRSPLFQVMLAFQNVPEESLDLPHLRVRAVDVARLTSNFDLSLALVQRGVRLSAVLEYSTDLFTSSTTLRMLMHLENLLGNTIADPDRPVSSFPLMNAAERHQLLREWNDRREARPGCCAHELFEERAAASPDAVAVVGEDGCQLTYGELDLQSTRLALHLRSLGVGPEVPVALCADRSPEMIVALLGVAKAGGMYVPLDPQWPQERLAFLLEEVRAAVLLTQSHLRERLPSGATPIVCLDQIEALRGGDIEIPPTTTGSSASYMIYTSGSTGRPKGVVIPHSALANYTLAAARLFAIRPDDRVLQFASISFDTSAEEIYPTLASGATLVLRLSAMLDSLERFLEVCKELRITVLDLPTALWHELAAYLGPGRTLPPQVRLVVVGGERALASAWSRWQQNVGPKVGLLNGYGPTEATIVATMTDLSSTVAERRSLTLGRPVANVVVYVLDRNLEAAPVGVAGEICIGGAGVARGYLGMQESSAQKFVPDPFSAEPGGRMYRSGDLARFLSDGEIEYLGRIDHQVKVRGFRIELGEIESVLGRHPDVRQAAVVVREDRPGDRRLVAYLVGSSGKLAAEALRRFLRESLPEHMVPSAFVSLDSLPLTSSGKVDRHALPAPEVRGEREGLVAPRTPQEEILAGIWAEVLGREQVGITDSFFDLGGHSLLATQVISRVRSVLGVNLPLRTLFETPTVAQIARRIGEARQGIGSEQAPEIVRQDPREGLPLSFAQQRLWFLDQLEPGGWTYNIPLALRIEGGLDPTVLQAALRELVRRHESLRTFFTATDGEPFQTLRPAGDPLMPQLDLAGIAPEARQRELRRLSRLEARRPFDLGQDPMLRAVLVHLSDGEHALLLTVHHIASDGWSMEILSRELGALYEAGRSGRPSPLPELPIQYSDFSFWQRSWLTGKMLAAEIAYWRERLSGAPRILELPTDRPRPAKQGSAGRVERLRLGEDLAEALRALSRQQGVTLFMLLLSAWQALLSRLTGQEDVSVGTPIAGRSRLELEGLIGFFVNTLVLRCDLSGDPGFGELLHRAREVVLDAHAHQDLPFEKLVEELKPERSLAHSPLFQVSLLLQQASRVGSIGLSGLRTSRLEADDLDAAKFDLTLGVEERRGGGLALALSYRTELFDPPSARRMLRQMEVLLRTLASEARQRISELPLHAAPELHQLLREWNDSWEKFPRERCIHELFEEQARLSPNSVAVAFEDRSLTYRELDRRANGLAWALRGLGVMPEVRVAICVERSLEMMIGLLAILKAGGAYVPLDPEYPQERLAHMIEDCGAPVLLTQSHLASILPPHSARTLLLDEGEHSNTPERFGPPPQLADPDHLMYVIYTSGSTGRPKGVMVRHRGIVNRLTWAQRAYPVTALDRVLQKASFSFDFSVWECFAPLLIGGCVVLARPGGHRDSAYLVETIRDERITLVHFVPSMLQVFLGEEQIETCRNLRFVFSGGEALTPELRDRFFSLAAVPLRNQYGPTEISIDVTEWVCHSPGPRSVPIGRPLANGITYVLDPQLRPLPIGVPGELFLGGEGLARGYLGRPELTAERFIADPFGGEPGGRIYRTGDLARYIPDGNLEFLGRVDHQVKVRGFRIELGEIESTLRRHSELHDAVVSILDSPSGGKQLVAYVVPRTDSLVKESELREFLSRFLPGFMVPPTYVVMESLSYLPNGKVDRRALPAPEVRGEGEGLVAPRTPQEEILAGIWAEVLGREQVGITDSFFDLGGHSLLATQVISRVRSVLGVNLPLRTLFETPTVAQIARRIGEARQGIGSEQAPEIVRQDPREGLLLSFAQQRLWFLDQLEPGGWTYNIPLALRIEGGLDPTVLQAALRELVRRHESLRTFFTATDGEPFQTLRPAGDPLMPQLDLAGIAPEARQRELRRLSRLEARRPFDLGQDPMLRAVLVHLSDGEHALLLTVHHIASDGWSMEILSRELGALYEAGRSGRPSPLPELPIQYSDFSFWQRSWLTGKVLAAKIAYWRERLSGAPHILELPTDRPRPAKQGSAGRVERLRLGEDLAEALRALSRQQGVTLFMLLLSAWQALLSRLTGQEDVSVGTPIAGRSRLELEGLIGFFVNTLVLRCDLSGDPGFGELLHRAREVVLDAHAHQDLPFEKLVEELKPERSLAHSPLFQVLLVLQNAGLAGNAALSEPRTSRLESDDLEPAKFDLTLGVEERRGGGLGLALSYRTELFDPPSVRRMLHRLEALLGTLATDPQRRISDLPVLTQCERAQLLTDWNDTGRPSSERRCLHELFAAQAGRSPEAVAVIDGERELSYGELDRWSNRLAHHLRELGVGPEVPVALCLERSARMVAAILGVLKAAGSYVPLDPAYPRERLRLMLEDSAAPVIVTESALAKVVPETAGCIVLMDDNLLDRQSTTAPHDQACPDNLAYVIYTSGSTGTPKGVAIAHRSVSALLDWAQETYSPKQIAGVLAATSICFDLSIFELFVPLTRGGTVILATNVLALPELPGARRVTLVNTVPSAIAELVRSGGLPPSVATVNLAGEALPSPLVEQIYALATVREVYNLYGPSEDTTYSTWARMDPEPGSLCPIGRPIFSSRSYVLDPRGRLVPVGSPGELFLGGEGLARGYLGRPDLTAERFVPDPFGPPGSRLYRTGDLVRHLPDGGLGFLGRVDHQVKVRGFRIELGEIETALRRHGAVDQTVVLAREDRPGDLRLVAYVVLQEGTAASEAELRSHLRQTQPEYMVPSRVLILHDLPLTPNGKIDRRALPAPEKQNEREGSLAPRDIVELELQRIWEEVLGVSPVGVADSFFDLGGHSLLAIKLITRIRRRFGRDLAVAALFQADTVERLALLLRHASPPRSSPLVEISNSAGAEALFFVHPGAGDVLGYAPLARRLAPWRFYGLQAPGIEGEREPLASVEDLAALYLGAVRSVQPAGPYRLGGWSMGGLVALEMARHLENEGERVGLVVLLDTRVPASAAPGPEDELRLLSAFAEEIGVRPDQLQLSPEEVAELSPDRHLSWVLERAWAARLLPSDMDLPLLERRLAVFRANVQAMRKHQVRPYHGKVVLFAPEQAPPEAAEAWKETLPLLWVEPVAGTHFSLVREPYVNLLAERLKAHLREAL